MSAPNDALVRVQALDGGWETLGVDRYPGIVPEGVAPTWTPAGPESMSFTIRRPPAAFHPDLLADTPVEWLPLGEALGPLWSGYVIESPGHGDQEMSVSCQGWAAAAQDHRTTGFMVHASPDQWQDYRALPGADLTFARTLGKVDTGGRPTLGYAQDDAPVAGQVAALTLDLGPVALARRVTVELERVGGAATGGPSAEDVYLRGHDTPQALAGAVAGTWEDLIAGTPMNWATNLIQSATLATPRRYVTIILHHASGAGPYTPANAPTLAIRRAIVYADPAYEALDASALTATRVLLATLPLVPELDQADTSQIAQTSLPIPELTYLDDDVAPDSLWARANDYHGYMLGVDRLRRLFLRPQGAQPALTVKTRAPGVAFRDASTGSALDVYNRVIVRGAAGDGTPLRVVVDRTGGTGVLGRRGKVRETTLSATAKTDPATMAVLGNLFLDAHARVPMKGTLVVSAPGAVTVRADGSPLDVRELALHVGEAIELADVEDPDAGQLGKAATVAAAAFSPGPPAAMTLSLDNTRTSLDRLMARMGVLQGR